MDGKRQRHLVLEATRTTLSTMMPNEGADTCSGTRGGKIGPARRRLGPCRDMSCGASQAA